MEVTQRGFLKDIWDETRAELSGVTARARGHVENRFSWAAVYPACMAMYRDALSA